MKDSFPRGYTDVALQTDNYPVLNLFLNNLTEKVVNMM